MKKRKVNFPAKLVVFVLIILLALILILGYIWRIVSSAEYFRVRDVVSNEATNINLSYLKGRNIFTLDLEGESRNIARNCPDCARVRLARIMPDRVFVEFVRRRPTAFIKLYRYFAVDESGFIFSSALEPDTAGLPVITGLETKIFGPKPGNRYNNKELSVALLIIKEAGKSRLLRNYRIQKINAGQIDNIIVQIPLAQKQAAYSGWKAPEKNEFLEVKFSSPDIADKVAIMAGLIDQEKYNLGNIKYIDLRFREPVIKFKEEKNAK